jgi:hypothetical protein
MASADVIDAKGQACRIHESRPPVFAHSIDPMDAKDWLRTVERELHTPSAMTDRRFCMVPVF